MGEKIFDYWKAYSDLADSFEKAGDFPEAARAAAELVRHFPGSGPARLRHAEALLRAEQFPEADAEFEKARKLDPLNPEICLTFARRLRDREQFAEAFAVLEPAVRLRPGWEAPAVLKSELLADLGRVPESIECAAAAAGKFPSSYPARIALLRGLVLVGDPRGQILLTQCIETARAQPALAAPLASMLFELKMLDEVIAACEQLRGEDKLVLPAVETLAKAYAAKGNASAALALLESLVALSRAPAAAKAALRLFSDERKSVAAKKKKTPKRVLMVSVNPRVREAKLAAALKGTGWEPILLHVYDPNYDVSRFFRESHKFTSPEQALVLAEKSAAPVHHVFSLHVDDVSLAFVREKLAVTIFDPSDIYDALISDDMQLHGAQRYCIKNADGLVSRQLTPRYAARQGGYKLPANVLYFPEYCWDDSPRPRSSKNSDGIHIVQTGYIDIERFTGAKASTALQYFEAFARAEIHVHIYQHLFTRGEPIEAVYQDFLRLGNETGHMHVHPNVPLDKMIDELAAYDFGLLSAVSPEEPMPENYKRSLHPLHLRGITASRCTDYMEAGLPVIIDNAYFHQRRLAARYGLTVPFTKELLARPREILAPLCAPEIRAEARRKSAAFTLSRHAPRLVEFYERCIERR